MELSIEQAKAIITTFGPCTVLYECLTPAELIEEAKEEDSLASLLNGLVDREDIHLEQRGNQWSGEDEAQFKADVASDRAFIRELKKRVKVYRASIA